MVSESGSNSIKLIFGDPLIVLLICGGMVRFMAGYAIGSYLPSFYSQVFPSFNTTCEERGRETAKYKYYSNRFSEASTRPASTGEGARETATTAVKSWITQSLLTVFLSSPLLFFFALLLPQSDASDRSRISLCLAVFSKKRFPLNYEVV